VIIGYARVSSTGQDFDTQLEKLATLGAEKVFSEKRSGLDETRPELEKALEFAREGDVFVVTKVDRLARSAAHLHQIVKTLDKKGRWLQGARRRVARHDHPDGEAVVRPRQHCRVCDRSSQGTADGRHRQGEGPSRGQGGGVEDRQARNARP